MLWMLVLSGCGKEEPEEDTGIVLYQEEDEERIDAGDSQGEALAVEICYAADDCLDWPNVIHEDAIDEPGDRDWLAVELEEGWVVTIGTAAWYLDEDTEPDTVLRLYDDSGSLLATNDDMPFSWQETDSALYFEALYTGTHYLEILEYSDYEAEQDGSGGLGGSDSELLGGSSWGYEVWGLAFTYDDDLVLENNDIASVVGQDQEYYAWWTETAADSYGRIGQEGDVDVREFNFDQDWFYTWSLYPGAMGNLSPKLSLYDADGNLLAQTEAAEFDFDGGHTLPNVGLMYHCKADTDYYVAVEDAVGGYGAGTFYSMFSTGYIVENFSETFILESDPDVNDDFGTAEVFNPVESSTYANLNYMYGKGAVGPTDVDFWAIQDNTLSLGTQDQYLNVWVQALGLGSLADVRVVAYDASGVEIASSGIDPDNEDFEEDPELRNVELSAGGAYIAVEVEEHGGVDDSSGFYLIEAWVYSEPI